MKRTKPKTDLEKAVEEERTSLDDTSLTDSQRYGGKSFQFADGTWHIPDDEDDECDAGCDDWDNE